MITIGIQTYNRKKILETMANSLYNSDLSIPHNIRIYDDCSSEYNKDFLEELFPTAKTIKINQINLKADKNMYQMYIDFLNSSDQLIFTADSDLIFTKNWLNKSVKLINKTNGIFSIFNSLIHEPYEKICEQFCLKKTIGAAGTIFSKERLSEFLSTIKSINNVISLDWQFSEYFEKANIPIYCVNNSLVQHIGYSGQNAIFYFDYGRNYKVDSTEQGQIINDIALSFLDDIKNKEKQRAIEIEKQDNNFLFHLYRCIIIPIKWIIPKKLLRFIRLKLGRY